MTLREDPSTSPTPPISLSAWAVEDADLAMLGMDPEQPEPTEIMNFCRAVLGSFALRADEVTFVIAGDFVESVKERLPDGAYRDAFGLERGAGMVGAKTMRVGDEIHVLFPAWMFLNGDAARANLAAEDAEQIVSTEAARVLHVRRTAVHEAQHVAMDQAGEDETDFTDEGWARQNFLTVAHQVIAEYRAEVGVPNDLREGHEAEFPVEALDVLRDDLRRIATVDYQLHLDVGRLSYDVLQQTHHVWKLLAYVAAARRVAGVGVGAPFLPEATSTEAWTLMVEEHWERFEGLLSTIPSGRARIDHNDLDRWTSELADILFEWLRSYGFVWVDLGENSEFRIESWDLLV